MSQPFPNRSPLRTAVLLFSFALLGAGCNGCGGVPDTNEDAGSGDGDGTGSGDGDGDGDVVLCVSEANCAEGEDCIGGVCTPIASDGGSGDGDGDDAGPAPMGELTVIPGTEIEFGAQLLGVSVTRDIQLVNTGDAPVTIFAVFLNDDSGEFQAEPTGGNIGEILEPDDVYLLEVSHTPSDGNPDQATIYVNHSASGDSLAISLFAEFKADAVLSATTALDVLEPSIEEMSFGPAEVDTPITPTVYLRNTGAIGSLLEVSGISVVPSDEEDGFAIDTDGISFPLRLNAWAAGLCPGGDDASCPEGTAGCTDEVCVDGDGFPVNAVALPVTYATQGLPRAAVLSLTHNAGGVAGEQSNIDLTGIPVQPVAVASPESMSFGTALTDTTAGPVSVTVTNTGAGPLIITEVELPEDAVFSVEADQDLDDVSEDSPIVINNGDAGLTFTGTFSPTTPVGYTGSITLHTNQSDTPQFIIALSGGGFGCQANATVNEQGDCECDEGYVPCGENCVYENPANCGDTCEDCTAYNLGDGTAPLCTEGQCDFVCKADYYDVDMDLEQSPETAGWDGCETRCVGGVPTDDGVPGTVNKSGVQSSTSECGGYDLGEVNATELVATNTFTQFNLYPEGDNDWFLITVLEGAEQIGCDGEIPCLEASPEDYTTTFELDAPSNYAFEVYPVEYPGEWDFFDGWTIDYCADNATYDGSGPYTHEWTREGGLAMCLVGLFDEWHPLGNGCGRDDVQPYLIHIKRADNMGEVSCQSYTLTVKTTAIIP